MKALGGLLAVALCGCRAEGGTPSTTLTSSVAPSASSFASLNAQRALDRLDTRAPLPLTPMMANHQKENMRDHLAAVQAIIAAMATSDFPAVEKAAAPIGYTEAMGQMCKHMGAGAEGFAERALQFHHHADRIGEAARMREPSAILRALSETLGECTSCHTAYKQQVVDDATSGKNPHLTTESGAEPGR